MGTDAAACAKVSPSWVFSVLMYSLLSYVILFIPSCLSPDAYPKFPPPHEPIGLVCSAADEAEAGRDQGPDPEAAVPAAGRGHHAGSGGRRGRRRGRPRWTGCAGHPHHLLRPQAAPRTAACCRCCSCVLESHTFGWLSRSSPPKGGRGVLALMPGPSPSTPPLPAPPICDCRLLDKFSLNSIIKWKKGKREKKNTDKEHISVPSIAPLTTTVRLQRQQKEKCDGHNS